MLSSTIDTIKMLSDKRLELMNAPKENRDAELLKTIEQESDRAIQILATLNAAIARQYKVLNAAPTSLSALPTGIYMLLLY